MKRSKRHLVRSIDFTSAMKLLSSSEVNSIWMSRTCFHLPFSIQLLEVICQTNFKLSVCECAHDCVRGRDHVRDGARGGGCGCGLDPMSYACDCALQFCASAGDCVYDHENDHGHGSVHAHERANVHGNDHVYGRGHETHDDGDDDGLLHGDDGYACDCVPHFPSSTLDCLSHLLSPTSFGIQNYFLFVDFHMTLSNCHLL